MRGEGTRRYSRPTTSTKRNDKVAKTTRSEPRLYYDHIIYTSEQVPHDGTLAVETLYLGGRLRIVLRRDGSRAVDGLRGAWAQVTGLCSQRRGPQHLRTLATGGGGSSTTLRL